MKKKMKSEGIILVCGSFDADIVLFHCQDKDKNTRKIDYKYKH